jgi:hypothetical protein
MVYFQIKNPNLGKFWRALGWKRLVYSMAILKYIAAHWYILWTFGNLVAIWHILPHFGIVCQDKSGNPDTLSLNSVSKNL